MRRPGFADGWLLVDENSGSWWREWRAVEVEGAVDLGVGGEAWVDAGAAEQVEGDEGLWEESIPEIEREIGVGAAEAGDEVVLKGTDGPFGGITAMNVRRGELEIDFLGVHELL